MLMSTISVNYSIIHNYRVDINSSEWSKEQISKFIEIMKRKQSQTVKYLRIKAHTVRHTAVPNLSEASMLYNNSNRPNSATPFFKP